MVIATFGPSTAWAGKNISFEDGRFALEGLGEISAQAVVDYDRQGHLDWAYDGLRDWAYQLAGQVAPAPMAPVTTAPVTERPAVVTPTVAPATGSPAPPEVDAAQSAAAAAALPPAAAPPEAAPAPPAQAPAVTSAAPAGPKDSTGWVRWLVAGVVVVVVLLIGIVFAGGRLRDGLGIALTLLAVVFVVLLIVTAIKPAVAGRWGVGARTLLIACGALAAGCFVLAGLLWWMPHYEVVAPADKRIALDDAPELKVLVVNRGLFGGTYSAAYGVDGVEQERVTFPLGAGDSRELTLSLPGTAERGNVLLSLGGASVDAKAVAPPSFTVAPLQLDPALAKLGDDVSLQTTVENTGDMQGTFGGVLLVNDREFMKQPVEIGPGATKEVTYDLTADKAGEYRLRLGDAAVRFAVVKPVRLSNGYVIKRSTSGGRAYVTVTNKTGEDAMVVLTRSSNKRKPVVAVFVRKGKKATVKGVPDGNYVLWDCCGTDWNWYMRDFYTTTEYKRWLQPLRFDTTASTRHWTSYWSDANYNYWQGHSQTTTHWTNWTVTLGTGESKYTKTLTESGFPQL